MGQHLRGKKSIRINGMDVAEFLLVNSRVMQFLLVDNGVTKFSCSPIGSYEVFLLINSEVMKCPC